MQDERTTVDSKREESEEPVREKPSSVVLTLVRLVISIFVCALILAVGINLFVFFSKMKPTPKEKAPEALLKNLIGMTVVKQPISLKISGYGTVEPSTTMDVSSEVKGKVVYVSPNLNDGDLVKKGEILFRIEKNDCEIVWKQAMAEIANLKAELALNKQRLKDQKLVLVTIEKSLELEMSDLRRKQELKKKGVVSALALEDSEQAVENKRNLLITANGKVRETVLNEDVIKAKLSKAEAVKGQAELDMNRCEMKSPLRGRIEDVSVYDCEYVNVGQKLFSIIDDSSLEIPVSLDARKVSRILNLKIPEGDTYRNWFSTGERKIPVTIEWTENPQKCVWQGKIVRISKYDSETRTLFVVVSPTQFLGKKEKFFPLVDGMFCKVTFAGGTINNSFKIPWNAIQLNGHVYVADDKGVISERKIDIINSQDDAVIVTSGIKNGEMLVTQRLPRGIINGMKVKVIQTNQPTAIVKDQKPPLKEDKKKYSENTKKNPGNG